MTIRALLLLGSASLAYASAASAQSASPPPAPLPPPTVASPAPADPPTAAAVPAPQPGLPPQRIAAMVRAHGFHPIGRPQRHGNLYVQRALDPDDMEYRLVIDSLDGRMVSVRPLGVAGPYAYGPEPYGPPPYRPVRYWGLLPPPDYGFGRPRPPRNIPGVHIAPPHAQPQPSTSAQAPLPRPRPYVMEQTGSIAAAAPASPAPPQKPLAQKTPAPPAAAPHDNGAAEMPPIAPLE